MTQILSMGMKLQLDLTLCQGHHGATETELRTKSDFLNEIRSKEFSFSNKNILTSFYSTTNADLFPGLKSATLQIVHEKDEPDLFLRFRKIKEENNASLWKGSHSYATFKLNFSFRNTKTAKYEEYDFSGPIRPSFDCNDTELLLYEKLCSVEEFKRYTQFYPNRGRGCWGYFKVETIVKFTFCSGPYGGIKNKPLKYAGGISKIMKKMLLEGQHSDFTIRAGGKTFPCHKSILACQSEVFSAMFSTNMTEAMTNTVTMEDLTSEGVEALLKYLYCSEVETENLTGRIVLDLFRAGHMYRIEDLESQSSKILASFKADKFDAKTAFELFEFGGNAESMQHLQEKAARIFKENADKYDQTDEFAMILRSADPKSVTKLFKLMASL